MLEWTGARKRPSQSLLPVRKRRRRRYTFIQADRPDLPLVFLIREQQYEDANKSAVQQMGWISSAVGAQRMFQYASRASAIMDATEQACPGTFKQLHRDPRRSAGGAKHRTEPVASKGLYAACHLSLQ